MTSNKTVQQQLAERRQKHAKKKGNTHTIPAPPNDSDIEIISADDSNDSSPSIHTPNSNTHNTNTHNIINNNNNNRHYSRNTNQRRIQFLRESIANREEKILRYTTEISGMEAEILEIQETNDFNGGKMEDIDEDAEEEPEDQKVNIEFNNNTPIIHRNRNNNSILSSHSTPNLIRKERERIAAQEQFDRELAVSLSDRFARETEDDVQFQRKRHQQRRQQRQRQMRAPPNEFNEWPVHHQQQQQQIRQSSMPAFSSFSSTISYNNNGSPFTTVHYSSSDGNQQQQQQQSNMQHDFDYFGQSFMRNNAADHGFQRLMSGGFQHPMMMSNMMMGMGMPFGNMLNVDDMSYEQLQQLFPNVPRGAQEESIQNLPTDKYRETSPNNDESQNNNNVNNSSSNNKKKGNDKQKCCICLEEFKSGEDIRRLPCFHIFHVEEIDHWLRINHVCPICRIPVDGEDANAHQQ